MRRVASRSWGRRFGSTPRRHAISLPGHLAPSRLATRGFWPSSLPVSLRKSLGQFQPLFLARRILVDPCRRQDAIAAWASLFDFPATAKRVTQPSELPLRSDSDWLACALSLFRTIPFRLPPFQKRIPDSARANARSLSPSPRVRPVLLSGIYNIAHPYHRIRFTNPIHAHPACVDCPPKTTDCFHWTQRCRRKSSESVDILQATTSKTETMGCSVRYNFDRRMH